MGLCGKWDDQHMYQCNAPEGHNEVYHSRRYTSGKVLRWSNEDTRCDTDEHDGWYCSLSKGHQGVHQGWEDHIIDSTKAPSLTWLNTEDTTNEVTDFDLFPDPSFEDMATLPTWQELNMLEKKRRK